MSVKDSHLKHWSAPIQQALSPSINSHKERLVSFRDDEWRVSAGIAISLKITVPGCPWNLHLRQCVVLLYGMVCVRWMHCLNMCVCVCVTEGVDPDSTRRRQKPEACPPLPENLPLFAQCLSVRGDSLCHNGLLFVLKLYSSHNDLRQFFRPLETHMRKVHSSGGEIAFVFDFYGLIQEYFFLSLSSPFYTYGQRQAKIHQSIRSFGNSLQGIFSYVYFLKLM